MCHKIANLRYSHVLPEFFYLLMYDEKHRAIRVTSEPSEKQRFIQKGEREYLLCEDCETHLSGYERYAAPIIKSIPSIPPDPSGQFYPVPCVDYPQFKLFQISLLWRSSVAEGPVFAKVNLGCHEEILRRMLLEENPGQPDEYGCMMVAIQKTKYLERMLLSPFRDTIDGHTCYRFVTGGLFWYFFFSRDSSPVWARKIFLNESGTLRILVAPWPEHQIVADADIAGLIAEMMSSWPR